MDTMANVNPRFFAHGLAREGVCVLCFAPTRRGPFCGYHAAQLTVNIVFVLHDPSRLQGRRGEWRGFIQRPISMKDYEYERVCTRLKQWISRHRFELDTELAEEYIVYDEH